jgi:hypothetical protein
MPTIQKQYNYRRDNYQKSQAFPHKEDNFSRGQGESFSAGR